MATKIKQFMLLETPGLSIRIVSGCRDCMHRRDQTCQKWAFPEVKWRNGQTCPDFQSEENR
jgi:hypothetical protein